MRRSNRLLLKNLLYLASAEICRALIVYFSMRLIISFVLPFRNMHLLDCRKSDSDVRIGKRRKWWQLLFDGQ